MAFPTTGLLDAFTRANANLGGTASWVNGIESGADLGLRVVSNHCENDAGGGFQSDYWNSSFAADMEAYCTALVVPGSNERIILWVRIQTPGSAAVDGYCATVRNGAADELFVERVDNDVFTTIATTSLANPIAAGDMFGLEALGTTITLYEKPSAGAWTSRLVATGQTSYNTSGFTGLQLSGTGNQIDDFSGGAIVTAVAGAVSYRPVRIANPRVGPMALRHLFHRRQPTSPALPLGQTFTLSLDGSISPTGTLAKQAQKGLAGSISPAGAIAKLVSRLFGGSISPTGGLSKLTAKPAAGSISPTGSIAKLVSKLLGGSISPSGALGLVKVILRAFAGSISPTGAISKQPQKKLAGSVSPAGSTARSSTKGLAGSISPAGGLSKLTSKLLGGSISPAGAIGRVKVILRSFAGSISPTGAIAKQPQKKLAGSVTPSGALSRSTAKGLAGSISPSGSISKAIGKLLAGAISPVGDLIRALIGANVPGTVAVSDFPASTLVLTDEAAANVELSTIAGGDVTLSDLTP